jgi:hypothetical protein
VRGNRALLAAYGRGGLWPDRRARLNAELRLVVRARHLLGAEPSLAHFVAEASPFLDSARTAAGAGRAATALLAAERPKLNFERATGGFVGQAAAPIPGRASRLRSLLSSRQQAMRTDLRFTYGNRGGFAFDIPSPVAVPPNVMDTFVDAVQALDSSWQSNADAASSSVRVRLGPVPVQLDSGGGFHLPGTACGQVLRAIDGAGGRTAVRLPACGR